uniref:Uncharacterized protein n=1 Tax=Ixodes ricinus TaxID=34613 RepID=A0A6B0UR70_IXORI
MTKSAFSLTICSSSSTHVPSSACSVRKNSMALIRVPFITRFRGDRKGRNSHFSSLASSISSGTARMFVKPFRKTTKTRLAPHLSADVAQSNAVSPAPRTITLPKSDGRVCLQPHIPGLLALDTSGRNVLDV